MSALTKEVQKLAIWTIYDHMHLTREREKEIRDFVEQSEGGFLGVIVAQPMIKELLAEIDRQRKVITKELTENDDYGAEYSFVLCCKEEINRLINEVKSLEASKKNMKALAEEEMRHQARQFDEQIAQLKMSANFCAQTHIGTLVEFERAKSENQKLRDALQEIGELDILGTTSWGHVFIIVREALK